MNTNIDRETIREKARDAYMRCDGILTGLDAAIDAVLGEVAKHNTPDKPPYFDMKTCPPPLGQNILVWMVRYGYWSPAKSELLAAGSYPYWMPMPDKPVSDDELAFDCILRDGPPSTLGIDKHAFHGMDVRALRYVWEAALAHRDNPKS